MGMAASIPWPSLSATYAADMANTAHRIRPSVTERGVTSSTFSSGTTGT